MRMRIQAVNTSNQFRADVEKRIGLNLAKCIQCSKCGGACEKSDSFDFTPRQIIELILDGLKEKVLHSRSMWMCAQCEECLIECPSEIPINKLMKTMRDIALEANIEPNSEPYDRELIKEFYCPKKSGNWGIEFADEDN